MIEEPVNGTYERFLDSLYQVKYKKLLMTHLPSEIMFALKYYEGYLTEDELREKQYEGRFWNILGCFLYILVDNYNLEIVDVNGVVGIYGRDHLPHILKWKHYYE